MAQITDSTNPLCIKVLMDVAHQVQIGKYPSSLQAVGLVQKVHFFLA